MEKYTRIHFLTSSLLQSQLGLLLLAPLAVVRTFREFIGAEEEAVAEEASIK